MAQFTPVYGTITSITPMQTADGTQDCTLLFFVMTQDIGPVTFTVTPLTYVEGQETLKPGDPIVAFYDRSTTAHRRITTCWYSTVPLRAAYRP